jgi:hypothetical protein
MPAVPFLLAGAAATGVAASIGTAAAALVGATITGAAATAIGAGVLSAGASLAQGRSLSDSLKGAVVGGIASFVGAGIAGEVTGAITQAASDAGATSIAASIGKVAGSMAGGAVRGVIGSTLSGQDPIEALIRGGLTAGLSTGVMEGVNAFTNEIPGFSSLKSEYGDAGAAAQRAINAGLAAGVLGQNVGDTVTQSLLGSLAKEAGSYINNGIKDLSSSLRSSYDETSTAGQALDNNIAHQNNIAEQYNAKLAEAQAQQSELQSAYNQYQTNFDQYNKYNDQLNLAQTDFETWYNGQPQVAKQYVDSETGLAGTLYQPEWMHIGRGRWMSAATGEITTWNDVLLRLQSAANHHAAEATKYADIVNNGSPALEANKTGLAQLESTLNSAKSQYTGLESAFLNKKAALDATVANYQTQEEKNAQIIKQAFDDKLAAQKMAEAKVVPEPAPTPEPEPTPEPTPATKDVVQQLQDAGLTTKETQIEAPPIQDTTGLDEGPTIPVNEAPTPDVVDQLLNSGTPSPDEDFVPTIPPSSGNSESVFDPTFGGTLPTSPEETDWNALYNTGLSAEEIAKREALLASLPGQEMQVTPDNWDSYNKNLTDIIENKGGYTSQWQTVGNDRVMVNDDGTGIGTNENGDSYALSREEVSSMIKNGLLNTADSGYVAATGGTGNTPGGSGPAPTTPPSTVAPPSTVTPPKTVTPTKPGTTTTGGSGTTGTLPIGTAAGTALFGLGQPTSNADLLNLLSSKDQLANIKSFKELFGEGLFGDSYVPPSAGGPQADADYGSRDDSGTASQNEGEEQLFTGGHVDDFDVDALLRILRG